MNENKEMISSANLKAGAICIGNGGGQSGVELQKDGHEVILINSSVRDLANQVVPAGVQSYIIEDKNAQGRGAGRNREIAKKLYSEWSQNTKIFESEYFKKFVSDKDIIFVITSTAGGTGSGITPTLLLQMAKKYPNKVIILIGILPRLSESVNSQRNTVEFHSEVEKINSIEGVNIPYMYFDLNRLSDIKIDEAYDKIAKDITNAVNIICGDMSKLTPYGMIDERNMLSIVSYPGLITVYTNDKIKMTDIQKNGIQKTIIDEVSKTSCVANQGNKQSRYYGLFLDIDDQIDDPVKSAQYDDLYGKFGEPFEIFVNYGITTESNAKFGLVVSGQSMPVDRFKECADRVKDFEENQNEKKYSIIKEASEFMGMSKDADFNKILGSAADSDVDADLNDIPDFLKSSI